MKKFTLAAALVLTLATVPAALATPLAPNSAVGAIDTIDLVGAPLPWGAALEDTGPVTVFGGSAFVVKMRTQVFRDTVTGYLDFLYTVENVLLDTPSSKLDRLTMFQYPNASFTDVYFVKDSGIEPLDGADRELDGTIGFNFGFGNRVDPGESSSVLIRTHDTLYTQGTFNAIDGAVATTPSFAPCLAPLPGSLVLFATGALSLGGGLFRRLRKGLTLSV